MRPASAGISEVVTHPFLDVARALSLEAAARLMELRLTPLVKERKPDHSLVTNADHDADRIIRAGLRKAFPDHAILTEESGMDGSSKAEFVWVVDPLDGTRAYAKGITGFSVMTGLLKNGRPLAGVVVNPLEGFCYEGLLGEGAFCTFEGVRKRVYVSARAKLREMPVITSTGFPQKIEQTLHQALPGPWVPAVNSVGVKVGALIRQAADIYINHQAVHYWDTCAPQIMLEEAGGVITFLDGTNLSYDLEAGSYRHRGPTLATNGPAQGQVLEILRTLKPPLM